MTVAIPRAARRPLAQLSRRATTRPIPHSEEPVYEEVYEMLAEAADLVSRADRQLRYARQNQAGCALQPVVEAIHEHIRQLPASARDRPRARPDHRCERCDC